MFFEDETGMHYPIARITSVGRSRKNEKGQLVAAVFLEGDGDPVYVADYAKHEILEDHNPIVPAYDGFNIISLGYHEANPAATLRTYFEPIIAWRFEGTIPRPLTMNSDAHESFTSENAIQRPNGTVYSPYEVREFSNLSEWREFAFAEVLRKIGERAEAESSIDP